MCVLSLGFSRRFEFQESFQIYRHNILTTICTTRLAVSTSVITQMNIIQSSRRNRSRRSSHPAPSAERNHKTLYSVALLPKCCRTDPIFCCWLCCVPPFARWSRPAMWSKCPPSSIEHSTMCRWESTRRVWVCIRLESVLFTSVCTCKCVQGGFHPNSLVIFAMIDNFIVFHRNP